jgi:hypothetical protein
MPAVLRERPLTFDPAFGKLGREIERFANHTKRLVLASQKHRELLERASDWTEGTAPLDRAPASPVAALRAIDKFARIYRADRQTLFGAYFAHHHLRQQAERSRELLRQSFDTRPGARARTCRDTYDQAYQERRAWVAALLEVSLVAAVPDLGPADYAVFNVGSLTDHEDVDLAIVVSSIEARDAFSSGFAVLNKTFLRFASKIQLFLTDQLPNARAGGLIEEYAEIVADPRCSVVVVMQLLGADLLCGSRPLAKKLDERVISRFFAESGNPLAHEGFLRAIMAELKHYSEVDRSSDLLSPKREIYIPSRLVIAAMRTMHGVRELSPPAALAVLAERDPGRRDTYLMLRDTFVQNEILRALIFLYVVKIDEIDLFDPTVMHACRRVAVLLGLGESARRSAETRLVKYYQDLRARAVSKVFELSFDISRHLRNVSAFRGVIEESRQLIDTDANLAVRMLDTLKRLKGGVFWDEIVELLQSSPDVASRLLADLEALTPEARAPAVRSLVRMLSADASSLLDFLAFVADRDRPGSGLPLDASNPMATRLWEAMMHVLAHEPVRFEGFVTRLDSDTEMEVLYRLAHAFPAGRLAALADFIEERDTTPRGERVVRALRSVIVLVHHHSNRTRRMATRIRGRIPEFVNRLGDVEGTRALARELTSQVAQERRPTQQVELLGDAFDVEALSATLRAILDGNPADYDADYIRAFDQYARELFKCFFRETAARSPMFARFSAGNGIAVFATGGIGRGEGFGADWDYFAVVPDDDRGRNKFFGKVIQGIAGAMVRRGIVPHNRLTERFNAYVVGVDELAGYLRHRTAESFIDEAEVIEARFMFGDPKVRRAFNERVRRLVMEDNREDFLRAILRELEDRRRALPEGPSIKHGAGGLREIQLLWLAVGVYARLPGPFRPEHLRPAIAALPHHAGDLRVLTLVHAALRRYRELYRLVIADQEEPLDLGRMIEVARDLRPLRESGLAERLEHEVPQLMLASAARVDRLRIRLEV